VEKTVYAKTERAEEGKTLCEVGAVNDHKGVSLCAALTGNDRFSSSLCEHSPILYVNIDLHPISDGKHNA